MSRSEPSLDSIFEELQTASDKLNAQADAANVLIRAANERLQEMGVGVLFASDKCVLYRNGLTDVFLLAYGKVDDTWQLCIHHRAESLVFDPVEFSTKERLLNAGREVRILAAKMLPTFLRGYAVYLAKLAKEGR